MHHSWLDCLYCHPGAFATLQVNNWTTSSTWVSSEIKQRRAAAKKAAEGSGCAAGFSSVIWASHCSFVAIFIRIDLFCKEWTYGSHWQCESRCCWFYNKIIVKDLRRMLGNMIMLPTFVRWYQYVIILPSTPLLWLLTMCVLPYKILTSSPSFWWILYGIFTVCCKARYTLVISLVDSWWKGYLYAGEICSTVFGLSRVAWRR